MVSLSGNQEDLDLRGEVCPYTFVRTKLKLETMPLGARLIVIVDFEPATVNVPRGAKEWGQEVEAIQEIEPGVWTIPLIKRTHERT